LTIQTSFEARIMKGQQIARLEGQIERQNEYTYRVHSQSGNGSYNVQRMELGWSCSCPDYIYRGVKCKHIYAVEISLKLRQAVQTRVIEPITSIESCIHCTSDRLIKWGIRHNKYGDIQKFSCKSCGKYFTVNLGFERMKHNPQGITTAMQLYFSGESLRNVAKSLRLIGVQVSHQTIYNWIAKYTELMNKYVEKLNPNVGDTWRADELWVKIKGDMKYVFALMDDETRYWIAQEVTDTKFEHDARKLFQLGRELAGKKPKILITDGLPVYHNAYLREFWTRRKETRTEHIEHIRLKGDKNNNKMERFNGEVRDREKVMRGLKKDDTPILAGYQIFHNYIRPHEALKGKTPSEACGVEVKGENKWITIIQNARLRENIKIN